MDIDLKGKVAIVTGAARGLGLLIAQDLAREGMHVVGADLRGNDLAQQMNGLARGSGARAVAVPTDIGQEQQVIELVARTVREFGRVDVLVNNAGIRQIAKVWETETAMWDRLHNANLKGHFLCTREVLKQSMLARNEGTLIFVSSGSGKKGEEDSSAYCASKWGVIGFAESVAKDLKATRIRVTSIRPRAASPSRGRETELCSMSLVTA